MENILKSLQKELKDLSDPILQKQSDRYFKEDQRTPTYGIKIPDVNQIARKYYNFVKDLPQKDIFELCENLWTSGYLEEEIISCHWSYRAKKLYVPEDIKIFEEWIDKYINNWASCDTLCNHTVGEIVMMYPQTINILKKWAKSPNRWLKRASAVSLIIPARKGLFITDIFEIADTLLLDKDDMVQKGYGWMLKVASEKHLEKVYNYVLKHKKVMPRTALRYAIEKMPQNMKKEAMIK